MKRDRGVCGCGEERSFDKYRLRQGIKGTFDARVPVAREHADAYWDMAQRQWHGQQTMGLQQEGR